MKIAWFTPFSPRSAIASYSLHAIRELSARPDVEITAFTPDVMDGAEKWPVGWGQQPIATLSGGVQQDQLESYDIRIYNLGNHMPFHFATYQASRAWPGIVILHDLVMHHFFAGCYLERLNDPGGYIRELEYSHGAHGREFGDAVIAGKMHDHWHSAEMLRFHMARSAVAGAYGVVVHSEFAAKALREIAPGPVVRIGLPATGITQHFKRRQANVIDRTNGRIRLLTFGMITENRCVADVLAAIGQSSLLRTHCDYYVVGPAEESHAKVIHSLIGEYGLENTVHATLTYQPDDVLHDYLASADIVINLRNPHMGESSNVLVEAISCGKPTIVWDHGSYSEFPDSVVAKVDSQAKLVTILEQLATDVDRRDALGKAALTHATETFSIQQYATSLLDFIEVVRDVKPVLDLADSVTEILSDMGAHADSPIAKALLHEIGTLAALE